MIESGLHKIAPRRTDYSLLHTFGATPFDVQGLPDTFSIYDGRAIPNQNAPDTRFDPPVRPLPYGCTGESQSFICGLEDGKDYRPDTLYDQTPPGIDGEGRDIRASLETAKKILARTAYFNCYGSGKIDDFDAVRIALWINQAEKRAVSVGAWWYWGAAPDTYLPLPSFKTSEGTLHNYIITGWLTNQEDGKVYLEAIPWCGDSVGAKGIVYISREIYNALMAQPWTGAFTLTKLGSQTPLPIGWQAIVDHLVYYVRNLFRV